MQACLAFRKNKTASIDIEAVYACCGDDEIASLPVGGLEPGYLQNLNPQTLRVFIFVFPIRL
jgi:hypothetical protein